MNPYYPAGPHSVPAALTRPSAAYKRHAWLATACLLLFVVLYFALAGWFAWTGWRLIDGSSGSADKVWMIAGGGASFFFSLFMLKALLFVERRTADKSKDIEITAKEEPQLFAFLYQLADDAGAPRPHRVYLSPRVNAGVFYDLSIINLLFPSKKNLDIGLGLVNVLTLGEFKAVLAHEFGHFAQRSMAVGRWVYIAQQVASHLITRRDAIDDFLRGLSRVDLRVAWIGWILSLIIWSIRSLLESAFSVVVLAQRALSREMEMQADLVAVSLTGSDALIHALHRIAGADDAWDRSIDFANEELAKGRVPRDLFAVQSRVIERMRDILGDPAYGGTPAASAEPPPARRLFRAELAAPPRMWLTHPLNHEREENAKRLYIEAPLDERSAWVLFSDAAAMRERVSAHIVPPAAEGVTRSVPPTEETLAVLDEQFDREYMAQRYRGVYLGRSVVRQEKKAQDLYAEPQGALRETLAALYPESLLASLEALRNLEREHALLIALRDGVYAAQGGVIRHRGQQIRRGQLPRVIESVKAELQAQRAQIAEHDRRCRGAYRAAARAAGGGWEAYLDGLLRLLHYADHSQAQLRDAQRALANTVRVATATRKVSKEGIQNTLTGAYDLYSQLSSIHARAGEVQPGAAVLARLGAESWSGLLGELKLGQANESNIGKWLDVIDGWVNSAAGELGRLSRAALEQLLLTEAALGRQVVDGVDPGAAPEAARVPDSYRTLVPGEERKLGSLDWWARFQTAQGVGPALARLLVAGGIVGGVLSLAGSLGDTRVVVYNGLAREVQVKIGDASTSIAPYGIARLTVPTTGHVRVEARTGEGKLIEAFDENIDRGFHARVYSVAGAAAIVEWTATYGHAGGRAPRKLGAPRWLSSDAEYVLEEPPKSIQTKGQGGTREVLSAFGRDGINDALDGVKGDAEVSRVVSAHARWDDPSSPNLMDWLMAASALPDGRKILAARLEDAPADVVTLRQLQDGAKEGHAEICAHDRATAAATPANANLQYIATRCIEDRAARDAAFVAGHERFPGNPWFAYAGAAVYSDHDRLRDAAASLELARKEPALAAVAAFELARVRRLMSGLEADLRDLAAQSPQVRQMLALETGTDLGDGVARGYTELWRGHVAGAADIAARFPDDQARLLRLAAASDGADQVVVGRALALADEEGLDGATVWASIGLALRQHRDPAPFFALLRKLDEADAGQVIKVVGLLRSGAPNAAVEAAMAGLPMGVRAQVCVIGAVARGKGVPAAWRDTAKRALFASERPYFS